MCNRKLLSILALVLVCAALLSACSRGGNVTTDPSGDGETTTNGSTTGPDATTGSSAGETTQPTETTVPGTTDGTTAPSVTEPPASTQPPVTTAPPATTAPQGGSTVEADVKYTVTVVDGDGNPVKNLIVELSNGKIASTNSLGVATFTLPKGNYTVTFKDRSGKADYSDVVEQLTASKTSITVTLLEKLTTAAGTLYNEEPYYEITEGQFKIDVQKDKVTYLLFVPSRSGIYEVSVSGTNMVLGSYGSPAYIYYSDADIVNNVWKMDVKKSNIGDNPPDSTTKYLLGVNASNGSGTCVVTVKRVGDTVLTAADYPWEAAKADSAYLVEHTAPEGKVLKDIDISDSTVTIVKDAEGYYHYGTVDGPYVMLRIDSDSQYLASFVTICSTSPLGVHYYDENGVFLRKVQYNDLVSDYAAICDSNGVCRLNDQLVEMLEEAGGYAGWWNPDSPNFLFEGIPYAKETVWLFACCYYA